MRTKPRPCDAIDALSDEALVERILSKNHDAFEILMRRHNQRLFRLARSVVGDDAEAEDVVQEAYLNAYAALPRFEGRSTVRTWLSRIVFHGALRMRRKKQRLEPMHPAYFDQIQSGPSPGTALETLQRSDLQAVLTQALDSLPESLRTVVMLRLVEGLSTRETAACLELSEANVKIRLFRAKQQLSGYLEDRDIHALRERFAIAGRRCDRIVATVCAHIRSLDDRAKQLPATRG